VPNFCKKGSQKNNLPAYKQFVEFRFVEFVGFQLKKENEANKFNKVSDILVTSQKVRAIAAGFRLSPE
jgi:hypothetical protein